VAVTACAPTIAGAVSPLQDTPLAAEPGGQPVPHLEDPVLLGRVEARGMHSQATSANPLQHVLVEAGLRNKKT
jgi:hypothetical protein